MLANSFQRAGGRKVLLESSGRADHALHERPRRHHLAPSHGKFAAASLPQAVDLVRAALCAFSHQHGRELQRDVLTDFAPEADQGECRHERGEYEVIQINCAPSCLETTLESCFFCLENIVFGMLDFG